MARPKRFELLTPWFVARYSIQLSYGRAEKAKLYTKLINGCSVGSPVVFSLGICFFIDGQ